MKKALILSLALFCMFAMNAQQITVSGKITDEGGSALPVVNVVIKGTNKGSISDFNGNFTIEADDAFLLLSSLGYSNKEILIGGRSYIAEPLPEAAEMLLETIVIGSRSKGRTKLETTTPVDVISIKEQAINMPQMDLTQMLVASTPSFSAFRSQSGDLSSRVDPSTLRWLAPNQMLVLVNGKRRYTSALLAGSQTGSAANATDLSFLVPDAIDRVEILRDGAVGVGTTTSLTLDTVSCDTGDLNDNKFYVISDTSFYDALPDLDALINIYLSNTDNTVVALGNLGINADPVESN